MIRDSEWSLETERLYLRRMTRADAPFMLSIWNDPAFLRNVGDRGIRTVEDAEAALTEGALSLYKNYGYGPYCMILKHAKREIGICGLFRRDNLEHPDIGFAVLPAYYRSGLTLEAARAVIEYARNDLAINHLTAIVAPQNVASIRLIEKLGMTFERGITMPGEEKEISLYSMPLS
ncbi:MAG: GNAT family N-acetyltransferase [Woeseiaceae bacterium]